MRDVNVNYIKIPWKRVKLFFCCLWFSLCSSVEVFAAAWLPEESKPVILYDFYYNYYDEFVDKVGNKIRQSSLRKFEFKPYVEYPVIGEDLSVGFSPSFQALYLDAISGNSEPYVDSNYALAYTDFFLKKHIADMVASDYYAVFSSTINVELAGLYDEAATPFFGKKQDFVQLALNFGLSKEGILYFDDVLFFDSSVGFRTESHDFFSVSKTRSFEADFALGYDYTTVETFMLEYNFSKAYDLDANNSYIVNRFGYDLSKIQFSYIRNYASLRVRMGFNKELRVRNTSRGSGALLSLSYEY